MPPEHPLLIINVLSVLLAGVILCVPRARTGAGGDEVSDSVVVLAMLAPLQTVLLMAALMAGLYLIERTERFWWAVAGIALPGVAFLLPILHILIS
jgi:hypothetical protein